MLPIIFIIVLSALAQLFLPWWVLAPVTFAVCFWQSSSAGKAFLQGFISMALLWAVYATFINYQNSGMLATRMGGLIFKSAGSSFLMVAVAALLGGLVSGLAGLVGYYVRQAMVSKEPSLR